MGDLDAFCATWRGPSPEGLARAALASALEVAVSRARSAHSGLTPPSPGFARWLGERASPELAPAEALARLHVEACYLAWACAQGDPAALLAFESSQIARVPKWISGLRPDSDLAEEVKQELREKLLLGRAGRPKILQYSGEGTLENWVRSAALRTALNLLNARRGVPLDEASTMAEGVARYEPEMDYIKERYRGDFARAFRDALTALAERPRALLRFQHLERLTPERIGVIYGVHRTTAARWLAEAHQSVLDGTRERLMERLKLSRRECESLVNLLKSRLNVTLTSLFQSVVEE